MQRDLEDGRAGDVEPDRAARIGALLPVVGKVRKRCDRRDLANPELEPPQQAAMEREPAIDDRVWSRAQRRVEADEPDEAVDREGVEHYRQQVEDVLNRLTLEAQAWAEAGTPKIDEVIARRQGAWLNLHKEAA